MWDRGESNRLRHAWPGIRRTLQMAAFAPAILGLAVGSPGCMVRGDRPVVGADSTLVYPSKLPVDVNASITFQLKDSATRDQAKRQDRERGRDLTRLKKERDRLRKLGEKQEKQRRLEEKRKAAAEKKAKKARKGKKARAAMAEESLRAANAANAAKDANDTAGTPTSDLAVDTDAGATLSGTALRDSLASIERRLQALAIEDSVAALEPWVQKRPDGSAPDERIAEMEEGARIQANVKLENVYARGRRPLTIHFVWLNPAKKKVFKRLMEYTPNDSSQVLTTSLTISPSKRVPGIYTVQVFLFRELIAEKLLELRGVGHEEQEPGGEESM